MLLRKSGVLALTVTVANAFQNTSPFFLYSTSELLTSSPSLVSANHLTSIINSQLKTCTSDTYIIVSQPGADATDYSNRHSAPHLRKKMLGGDKAIRSTLTVEGVLGQVETDDFSRTLQDSCGAAPLRVDASTGSFTIAEDMKPRVINLDFPALPAGTGRSQRLVENDAFLASVLDLLSSKEYTVIYTTSPSTAIPQPAAAPQPEHVEPEWYEMDSSFQAPVHMELKRDLSLHERVANDTITLPDGPLFERYQYFTPGLFMGLLIAFILVMILYVAISGVASLQVSYAAFDREMGPVAQKTKAQ